MYDASIDDKWNRYWLDNGIGLFDEKNRDKKAYVIDTPPPFTSGTLHMGHVTSYSLIDFIARYKRMKGFNVLYPQGWDTQGFPTEKAVEKKFGFGLSREEFYNKCVEIAQANLDKMKEQMYRMGFSPDYRHEYTTMSQEYRAKVQLSLIMMHDKGMVYRGNYPVEWCWKDRSAIAHAETEEKEEETVLSYLNFEVEGSSGRSITIATTRPELLHACVAVAINPKDERFKNLRGSRIKTPIFGASVDVIEDDSVDMEFGTGAEMVCTFGDKVDREMYYRHKLRMIESMDEKGLLKNAQKFTGMRVTDARAEIIKALEEAGALVKKETVKHAIKVHDRCGTPIELIMSVQWFIKVKEYTEKIKLLANEIKWVPEFTKRYLEDWANFIDYDWIISRNRVFGTPLPFWYCEKCGFIATPGRESLPVDPARDGAPHEKCPKCGGPLKGETATCDVWVDSSITPLIISGWPDNRELFGMAYPTALRLQGTEIIRTWAFYTIFRSWALTENKPFENMLVHGMILAPDGKRMSKSKGIGASPDEVLAKYPVDTVRLWCALSSAIGKDKPFIYNDVEFAKSFITKLFNSFAFVETALKEAGEPVPFEVASSGIGTFDMWILNRLNSVVKDVNDSYEKFNFYDAANTAINFYWHEFCDYYIESVKYRIYSKEKGMEESRHAAAHVLKHVLDTILKLLAPIMPHASEELFSKMKGSSIFLEGFPENLDIRSGSDYVINGIIFKSAVVGIDYESVGAFLNAIISDVRKAKAREKKALNFEITSININVPEEYYKATLSSKEELVQICKAKKVEIAKGEYSVTVNI
ncbi:MAG: valine--tRNA ligase [Candidatus Micrarchaeota archaeon]|nr:valine--tRNA ligase [Candidatus Micrarchaeota archaeon]